jgi:cytochrome c oxidase subunit 4
MKEHITVRTYLIIYAWLMILALVSASTVFFHLGTLAIFIAMSIAIVKAVMIILYFMHVKENPPLIWLACAAGFMWLLIMFIIVFTDYMGRFPGAPLN